MKIRFQVILVVVVVAVIFAVSKGTVAQQAQLGPVYAVPAQNTPPPDSSATTSGTTQAPSYAPIYQSTAPVYVIPPQNTPPPTTPGENP